MLSIPGVARDQVWYEQPPFYNSNFSKPNRSASLFGEAQLEDTKLRSAAMAPGSCSCRNAPPRSRLGIAISMLLWTPSKKEPHTKRCVKFSPHHNFRQVHRRRPLDDDNVLHGFFPSGSSHLSQTHRLTRRAQELRGSFRYRRRHWHQPYLVCSFILS